MTGKPVPVPVLRVEWVMAQPVPSGVRLVLLALVSCVLMDDDRTTCWPGQEKLTQMTGIGERTVRRHLQALEDAGLIGRQARYDSRGKRTSDEYVLPRLPTHRDRSLPVKSAGSEGTPGQIDPTTGQNGSHYRPFLVGTTGRVDPPNQPIGELPRRTVGAASAAARKNCLQNSHDEETLKDVTDILNEFFNEQMLDDDFTVGEVHHWFHQTGRPVENPRRFVASLIEEMNPQQLRNWVATAAEVDS